MKNTITIVYLLLYLENIKGTNLRGNDDDSAELALSGQSILSKIMKQNGVPNFNDSYQSFQSQDNQNEKESSNILNMFLNRFQPALDRELKRPILGKPLGKHYRKYNEADRDLSDLSTLLRGSSYKNHKKREVAQVCTRVPGKIMCKYGRYTYVINTKGRDLENEELEKILYMMNQRISDGDRIFDLSILSPKSKPDNIVSRPESGLSCGESLEESPIMVECSPVNKPSSRVDIPSGYQETIYSCRWHPLKLKRDIQSKPIKASNQNDDVQIIATPRAKTCSTQLFVRKFTDICTEKFNWCMETTLKPCSSTLLPHCIPWCNPFFRDNHKLLKQKRKAQHRDVYQ